MIRDNQWTMESGFEVLPGNKCFLYYQAQVPTRVIRIDVSPTIAHCFLIHGITCGVNSQMKGDPIPAMLLSAQDIKFDALVPGQQFSLAIENISDKPLVFAAIAKIKETV